MGNDSKPLVINLIQDVATPHNNILIAEFKKDHHIQLKLWYAVDNKACYKWSGNITHQHFQAEIYGEKFNWRFIKYCLTHPNEKFWIVGWANSNTRLISFLFFLLRRPFNHWTDLTGQEGDNIPLKKRIFRGLAYKALKYSKAKVFGVGITSMNYFRKLGFPEERLVNLPIFLEVDKDLSAYRARRSEIIEKYQIEPNQVLLSAGSRIVKEKGYDLLVQALALIPEDIRRNIRVVIVGSGPYLAELEKLIAVLDLTGQFTLVEWLEIEDFKAIIANSDIFIHPARRDSYGGTLQGMALGVPVIGSYQAGAAADRIVTGKNGFLYDAEDTQGLADLIILLCQNQELRKRMGDEAHKTALRWPPRRGYEILTENIV